ncbi:hypothetical protein WJX81_001314 [Elliptochloris bilobata]|uniref:Uncharacterized protein n=1 Tax=Elliptochloris bilobata TaxID=381761 RepID=A0AAW1QIC3_9CHLO
MAGGADEAGLAGACDVICAVMRHKHAKMLFNQPVDASQFPDYRTVIKQPMDLGTILARLREGEASGWQRGPYSTPDDVLSDVSLVWTNCNEFNCTPADAPTRYLCAEVKSAFDAKWKAAGLVAPAVGAHGPGMGGRSAEDAVDGRFTAGQDDSGLPVRLLDAFQLLDSSGQAVTLEVLKATSQPVAEGMLVLPEDRSVPAKRRREQLKVAVGPVTDWRFSFGPEPSIAVCTAQAWYELLSPAARYAGAHAQAVRRLRLGALAAAMLAEEPGLAPGAAVARAAVEASADARGAPGAADVAFVEAQLLRAGSRKSARAGKGGGGDFEEGARPKRLTLRLGGVLAAAQQRRLEQDEAQEAGVRRSATPGAPAQLPAPAAFGAPGAAGAGVFTEGVRPQRAHHAAPLKMRLGRAAVARAKAQEEGDEWAPRAASGRSGMSAAQRAQARQAAREAAAAARALAAAERAEEARLAVEERKAATKARVKREREAIVARGPPPQASQALRLPADLLPELLTVWELLATLASLLQVAPIPFWRLEAARGDASAAAPPQRDGALQPGNATKQVPPLPLLPIVPALPPPLPLERAGEVVDVMGESSAVVLREVHLALLRGVEGRGLGVEGAPPPAAFQLVAAAPGGGGTTGGAAAAARAAAAATAWMQRTSRTVLGAPLDVVGTDAREAAAALAYGEYSDLGARARVALLRALAALALEAEPVREHLAARVEALTAPRPRRATAMQQHEEAEAGAAAEWERWMCACRVGLRRPLGSDMQRRRFWALGGRAGAFRVYVEEDEGRRWGWYEGEKLVQLVGWLHAGNVEREAGLLKALAQAPLPRVRDPTQAPGAGEAGAGPVAKQLDLELARPDGFRGIFAPQLRGEGNWAGVAQYGSAQSRVQVAAEALLGTLPFWYQGASELRAQAAVHEALAAVRAPAQIGAALLAVEERLASAGRLDARWMGYWRGAWRHSARTLPGAPHALNLLASLQEHMIPDPGALPRLGFERIAKEARCELYFPKPGEPVWEALRDAVAALRPFERFRVVSVAYRRTLLDGSAAADPAKGHAAVDDAAGAAAWPTAWLLLRPVCAGPGAAGAIYGLNEMAGAELAVPLRVDGSLPDCVVRADVFDRGMQRAWHAGERFRMFFAGKGHWRAGGVYYTGTVKDVLAERPAPGASLEQRLAYDPWEAIAVTWDARKGWAESDVERVSAWELEPDQSDAAQRGEEARRAEEAASRAARASALAARRGDEGGELPAGAAPAALAPAPARWPTGPLAADEQGLTAADAQPPPRRPEADDGAVAQEVLEQLQPLGKDAFVMLLANWTRGVKGKFKVPIFAHRELDLHTVFWAVQERGGYDAVSGAKLWKEVCRCLDIDLRGQTSASYNMRLNYERCLLEFEGYLAAGAFSSDLAAGLAPSANAEKPYEPRAVPPAPREPRSTRGAAAAASPTPDAEGAPETLALQGMDGEAGGAGLSFTEMLLGEDEPMEAGPPPPPPLAAALTRALQDIKTAQAAAAAGKGRGGRAQMQTSGEAMRAAGAALVGRHVLRFWPDSGGWWEATVGAWDAASARHRLVYHAGSLQESEEWRDLGELGAAELRTHPAHPLPTPPPPPPLPAWAASGLPAAVAAALQAGASAVDLHGAGCKEDGGVRAEQEALAQPLKMRVKLLKQGGGDV